MATQKGIIKLEGAVGDLSFYKRKGKYFARSKGGVSGDRIKNDPAFERTRENQQEFGRACASGKLLRTALRNAILQSKDSGMTSRLTQTLMKIIHSDGENMRGQRTIGKGDLDLLRDFQFNRNARLDNTLLIDFETVIDRESGIVTVQVPAFVPAVMVASPEGASHALFVGGACEIDFESGYFYAKVERSGLFPMDNTEQAAINLSIALTASTDKPVLVVLGIEFYQVVNGEHYAMKNGTFNAMALIKTDQVSP